MTAWKTEDKVEKEIGRNIQKNGERTYTVANVMV
jgi:hypothetical protein